MIEMFSDMIKGLPDMSVRFPDMIKKTPGTEKTPDTENFTPDTTILDTLPDPKSKSSPPAGRGRTEGNRPCPFLPSFDVISLKRKCKKNIVVRHVFL
jgi:hypothetical protein